MYAIKLAATAGYRIVTTSSPRNFDLVRSLGASAVFDYKDPSVPEKIKTWVKDQGIGPLRKGLDNISENGSLEAAAACFDDGQGELAILRMILLSLADVVILILFGSEPQRVQNDTQCHSHFWMGHLELH
jgi:hypothetical protein